LLFNFTFISLFIPIFYAKKVIDVVFVEFAYDKWRESVAESCYPIEISNMFSILSRQSRIRNQFEIFKIFDIKIWLCLIISFFVCTISAIGFNKTKNFPLVILEYLGIFLGLGTVISESQFKLIHYYLFERLNYKPFFRILFVIIIIYFKFSVFTH
jgi:hypothetical protein